MINITERMVGIKIDIKAKGKTKSKKKNIIKEKNNNQYVNIAPASKSNLFLVEQENCKKNEENEKIIPVTSFSVTAEDEENITENTKPRIDLKYIEQIKIDLKENEYNETDKAIALMKSIGFNNDEILDSFKKIRKPALFYYCLRSLFSSIMEQQPEKEVIHQSRNYTFAINDILQTEDSGVKELYCNYEMYEGIICNDDQCSEEYRNLKIQALHDDNEIIDVNTFKILDEQAVTENGTPKLKFEILNKVGKGRYSDVYRVLEINSMENYVIKFLKPVKRKRIFREILILNNLNCKNQFVSIKEPINVYENYYYKDNLLKRPYYKLAHQGYNNVIKLNHFNCNNKVQYKLIFESAQNGDFKSIKFTKSKLKKYTWELLKGIDYIHSMGIMHRDIKPHNICYNPETDTLKIIDFGLAEFYHPLVEYNVRVASRVYKSPELLVNYKKYDYSLDLWSLGCVLAAVVFQKDPFFHGKDNNDQLLKIIKILGTDDLVNYMKKYDIRLTGELKRMVNNFEYCIKKPWRKIAMEKCNKDLYDLQFVEFIDGLLCYDHQERLTAREAMMVPWLDEVRE
ncbi:hypothetical protein QEN19_002131 [Hanseniaspora menglaensis]